MRATLAAFSLALVAIAASASPASGQGLCLILLGCSPNPPPVVRPPAPVVPEPCEPLVKRGGGDFVGMVSEDVFWDASAYRRCTLNDHVASGVEILRQTFDWAQIEHARGRYDFSWYDRLMEAVARRRLRVLPILFNAPRFRSSTPRRRRGGSVPRRHRDMGQFAARVVRRYGPRGSFWRSRPDLPRVPVRSWQVWNEPNLPVYWPTGPSAREYTRMLQATARQIRRADPGAEIVTAGIADSGRAVPLGRYVAGMYRAGAKLAFDTLAVSAYAGRASGVLALVRRARRLMNREGDRGGGLWVTEFGWATGGPRSPYRVTASAQASNLSSTLRSLYRSRRRLRLRGAVYYNWRDGKPYPPLFQDFFGLHTGLLDVNAQPKAAYFAFRKIAPRLR